MTMTFSSTMSAIHHARRIVDQANCGNPFVTEYVIDEMLDDLSRRYSAEENDVRAHSIKVEIDRLETITLQ